MLKHILKKINWEDSWTLIKSSIIWVATIAGFLAIFFEKYIKEEFSACMYFLVGVSLIIITFKGLKEVFRKKLELSIRGKDIEILKGEFWEYNDNFIKVIPVNEYFDTIVDEHLIPKTSLYGQFLERLNNEQVKKLDEKILSELRYISEDKKRKCGKKFKYEIGEGILWEQEYLLVVLSKFGEDNVARLSSSDYIQFLAKMWLLVNKYGILKETVIPLIGGGPSNIEGVDFEKKHQYLIESILYTFKMSSINTNIKLHIVLRECDLEKINFIKLEKFFK